jgi:hypothetical protein
VVTETRVPIAPPPPAPATTVEEGEAATETAITQVALEAPSEAGPSVEGVVVVLDEDSAPPPPSESRDVVMAPVSEPAQVSATVSLLPTVEVPVPSPTVEVKGPPATAEVAESSSARVALTAEEMMELVTCRYIDFPGVGVIDLEAPQLAEKVYEVVAERMFNEPTIMETTASVSKALQEYERADDFASAAAANAGDAALAASTAPVEASADATTSPSANDDREAPPSQLVETAGASAPVTEADATEVIVGEEESSPPRPVAAEAEGVETRVPDEPAAVVQESATPVAMTRATSPEIREAEETGASMSQGAVGREAQTLELVCTSWAATSGLNADSEGDEEATARHTLECGMTWARRAFDELILPTTSVSSLVKD